jgi:hypothetical protein
LELEGKHGNTEYTQKISKEPYTKQKVLKSANVAGSAIAAQWHFQEIVASSAKCIDSTRHLSLRKQVWDAPSCSDEIEEMWLKSFPLRPTLSFLDHQMHAL